MKKIFPIILFLSVSLNTYSQETQDFVNLYATVKNLKTASEFDSMACEMLKVTDYILTHPYQEDTVDYKYAINSLIKWMKGTGDYHIITGGKIIDDCEKGSMMKNIYKACMTKFLFENDHYIHPRNPGELRYVNINEVREIIYGGTEIFMEYLSQQDKSVINKNFKKGLKKYQQGKLEEYTLN